MNKNELYHSDSYLGETYNDGLYHFKYLYKKKINGKWRYYYESIDEKRHGDNKARIYEKVGGNPNSKYGTYVYKDKNNDYTVNVKKSNKLFTSGTYSSYGSTASSHRTHNNNWEVGVLAQTFDKAKKKINKGRKWLSGLFDW